MFHVAHERDEANSYTGSLKCIFKCSPAYIGCFDTQKQICSKIVICK